MREKNLTAHLISSNPNIGKLALCVFKVLKKAIALNVYRKSELNLLKIHESHKGYVLYNFCCLQNTCIYIYNIYIYIYIYICIYIYIYIYTREISFSPKPEVKLRTLVIPKIFHQYL